MTKPKLTEKDFRRAAERLRCEVAAIKAVAQVESKGAGFYGDGFPVILFERHKFYKYAKPSVKKDWRQYSDICNPDSGGYGPAGKNQRVKFSRAMALDPDAAMKACSWGKFQIMGFNYEVCGFKTVGEFVDAMKESEGRQLDAFVAFVIGNKLDKYLRSKDWAKFANGYNGSNYEQNQYDTKMATAYRKFVKEAFAPPSSTAPVLANATVTAPAGVHTPPAAGSATDEQGDPPTTTTNDPAPSITETKTTEVTQTGHTTLAIEQSQTVPKGDPPEAEPTKVTTNGPLSKWLFSGGGITAAGGMLWGFIQGNLNAVAIGIICLTLLIIVIIFRGAITDAIRMQTAADPDKKNVT